MKKIVSIIICMLGFGCFSPPDTKPKILVTIPPYADLVKRVVGDQVTVEVLVPPGVNPHTYEPKPDQMKHFIQAQVWFRTGDPIENKMVQFLKERDVKIVDLSARHPLLQGHSHSSFGYEEKDLHLWMSPTVVIDQVNEISTLLSEQFPDLALLIQENTLQLQSQLKQLDVKISRELTPFQGRSLLVSHPALGYYCQRYGLHQLSIEVEGKDPRPQDIAHLLSVLKDHPVPVILIEPQYNKKGALLLAQQLHIPHEEVDPYDKNYFRMLNRLTEIIVKYYDYPHP